MRQIFKFQINSQFLGHVIRNNSFNTIVSAISFSDSPDSDISSYVLEDQLGNPNTFPMRPPDGASPDPEGLAKTL